MKYNKKKFFFNLLFQYCINLLYYTPHLIINKERHNICKEVLSNETPAY